jgi:hypothetical protein
MAALILFAYATAGFQLSFAQAQNQKYPLFLDANTLRDLGIAVRLSDLEGQKRVKHFAQKCYIYPGVPPELSLSDAFVSAYSSRGFTLRTLCLAILSTILFDPNTGTRLPTVTLIERSKCKPDADCVSGEELPFNVPDCFKNGTPLADCSFNFDPVTGKRMPPGVRQRFAAAERALDQVLSTRIAQGQFPAECTCKRDRPISCKAGAMGTCSAPRNRSDFLRAADILTNVGSGEAVYEGGPFAVDFSSDFPRGYGYGMYADFPSGPKTPPGPPYPAPTAQSIEALRRLVK